MKLWDRFFLSLAFGAVLIAAIFWGCNAHGQDITIEPPVMYFPPPTNEGAVFRTANQMKRPAQLPVPPLPNGITRTVTTNGLKRITIIEQEIAPPPLIQDRPKTNAFWVMCPHCSVRAIRSPLRMETNGVVTVPDGDQIERTIYFRCCHQEFKARNFKFVETPIAEEVTVPAK